MKKFIRITDIVLAVVISVIFAFVAYGSEALPAEIISYSAQPVRYRHFYSVAFQSDSSVDYRADTPVSSQESELRLFGIIPVKSVQVTRPSPQSVFVSGESFGIKLYTDGVIVVGTRDVEVSGRKCNPAREAGIVKGDIITEINGRKMYDSREVEEIFNDNNGRDYTVTVRRNGLYKTFTLSPVYSASEGCYKVGLWVRDSTAGIGTVTFYNPANQTVAALGHPITDVDTQEIMPILDGEAVKTEVTKIYRSTAGETGSILCDFSNEKIGRLTENKSSGIYGSYTCDITGFKCYEVAPAQDAERGGAQLICTLDGDGPKMYDVEITRISYRENNNDRNMVVRITDEELLKKTGGIIQGMSGSPIIQNGRLVGALTHVIVDNPVKGYAIFAQKMLDESKKIK
jgi:stage IV sporulation protein B